MSDLMKRLNQGGSTMREAAIAIDRLTKENKKLRDAVAPFASLGRNELRSGDFNRARRALSKQPVNTKDEALSIGEMRAQAKRCACGGADDMCPCQNIPDERTIRERRTKAEGE